MVQRFIVKKRRAKGARELRKIFDHDLNSPKQSGEGETCHADKYGCIGEVFEESFTFDFALALLVSRQVVDR